MQKEPVVAPDETVEDHKDEEIVATKPEAKGRGWIA